MPIDDWSVVSKQMQVQDNLWFLVPTFNQMTPTRSPVPSRNSVPNFGTSTVIVEGYCSSGFCHSRGFYDNKDFEHAGRWPHHCLSCVWSLSGIKPWRLLRFLRSLLCCLWWHLSSFSDARRGHWQQEQERRQCQEVSRWLSGQHWGAQVFTPPLGTSGNQWVRVFEENLQVPRKRWAQSLRPYVYFQVTRTVIPGDLMSSSQSVKQQRHNNVEFSVI